MAGNSDRTRPAPTTFTATYHSKSEGMNQTDDIGCTGFEFLKKSIFGVQLGAIVPYNEGTTRVTVVDSFFLFLVKCNKSVHSNTSSLTTYMIVLVGVIEVLSRCRRCSMENIISNFCAVNGRHYPNLHPNRSISRHWIRISISETCNNGPGELGGERISP